MASDSAIDEQIRLHLHDAQHCQDFHNKVEYAYQQACSWSGFKVWAAGVAVAVILLLGGALVQLGRMTESMDYLKREVAAIRDVATPGSSETVEPKRGATPVPPMGYMERGTK